MTRSTRMMLGVLSIWPALTVVIFMALMIAFTVYSAEVETAENLNHYQCFLMSFLAAGVVLGYIVMIGYIVHIFKGDHVPPKRRHLWLIVLLMGQMWTLPAYWYVYIWRQPELTAAAPQPMYFEGDRPPPIEPE